MLLIFPAIDAARSLESAISDYRKKFDNPIIPRDLTLEECFKIVLSATDDALNQRLCWAPSTRNCESLLRNLYPNYEVDAMDGFALNFQSAAVEDTVNTANEWISSAVPIDSWDIWYLRPMSNKVSDLILEKGTDYRIVDWTRRIEIGEWATDLPPFKIDSITHVDEESHDRNLVRYDRRRSSIRKK